MYDVVLFGGTDEGRKLAVFLREKKVSHIVCVATSYGAKLLNNENVRIGRMNAAAMTDFFLNHRPKIVIDATHPYAAEVTGNIKRACTCPYIRVTREDVQTDYGKCFDTTEEAAQYLKKTRGNILLTTGSKEISLFSDLKERAYARVLNAEQSVRLCLDAGFTREHIISASPPFSKNDNAKLIKKLNIKYLVTKRTGKIGGFSEKIEAARENGAECIIINRPTDEKGISVSEAENKILELL